MFLTPTLTVSLSAIVANWQRLRARFAGDECAAVVKADAYGLGAIAVSTALEKAGCHTFFVATLDEAIALRTALPDVRILVFHGVQAGEEFAFAAHRLIPVLNSIAQIERWKPVAAEHVHAVSALHVDTAMARMGLEVDEFAARMQREPTMLEAARVGLILSHFACSPEANHPLNAAQLARFQSVCALAPAIPASLCNSGGVYLAPEYHFNLARPGCSLYGIAPQSNTANPMQHVATWHAPILATRTLEREQTVRVGVRNIVFA
jgi:alanine racemase